jgi:hypothetical protein
MEITVLLQLCKASRQHDFKELFLESPFSPRIHHLKHRTTENTEFFSVLSRPSGKKTKLNVS